MDSIIKMIETDFGDEIFAANGSHKAFFKKFDKIFDNGEGYDNIDSILEMFSGERGSGVSKSSFTKKKKMLTLAFKSLYSRSIVSKKELDYVESIQYNDVVDYYSMERYMFENLDDFLRLVDLMEVSKYNKVNNSLITERVIVILMWYGFSYDDMIILKKNDVNLSLCQVNGVDIPKEYFDYINYYALSESEISYNSSRILIYKTSDKLFRSWRSKSVTQQFIVDTLYRFNDNAKRYGKEIYSATIKKNAMFCEIYELEASGRDAFVLIFSKYNNDIVSARTTALDTYNLYNQWKRRYKE